MRRLLGLLAVSALAAGLVPTMAQATHSNGQGPAKDFVTGTLKLTLPTPLGSYPGQIHNNGSSDSPSGTGVPAAGPLLHGHLQHPLRHGEHLRRHRVPDGDRQPGVAAVPS